MITGVGVRRLLIEWLGVLMLVLAVLWAASSTEFVRKGNHYTYDRLLPAHERAADDRIVLVMMDERSMEMLGRWPWSRDVHVQLLNTLAQQQPRGVLMDVLFTEGSVHDEQLAQAMAHFPRFALPVLLENNPDGGFNAKLPVAPLADAAHLGHIALTPDEDGVIRQATLSRTDRLGRAWPLLVRQMLRDDEAVGIPSEGELRVPFNVPQGSYIRISYADVVSGALPEGMLRDKYVLIGPTAVALGDRYPTPSSGLYSLMPGVEIQANVLDALLNGLSIQMLDGFLWVALPVVLLLILLLLLAERWHVWCFIGVLLGFLGLVCALLWYAHWWWPPLLSCLGLLLAYVLWTWRRVVLLLKYVQAELRGLRQQTGGLVDVLPQPPADRLLGTHRLERDMVHVQNLNQFVSESLTRMPMALCLVDADGRVLMHNEMARQALGLMGVTSTLGVLVAQFEPSCQEQYAVCASARDWGALDGLDWYAVDGRVYQLHVVPIELATDSLGGVAQFWQIGFVDLSSERSAQKQRNELMAFLSHDMRTPQVSILALLDIYQNEGGDSADVITKVKAKVHDTLASAKSLVELARAQSHDAYRLEEVNVLEVIQNAIHDLWPQASAKQIELRLNPASDEYFDQAWVIGDGEMLVRALVNVMSNSLRYSPSSSCVEVSLNADVDDVTLVVEDEGRGMSVAQLHALNHLSVEGLRRVSHEVSADEEQSSVDAAGSLGVGLHMVRAVVRQHHGRIGFEAREPQGTRVTLVLPRL